MSHFEYGGKSGKVKFVISKIDGNTYCKTNGQFKKHLTFNKLSELDYYLKYIDMQEHCPYCNNIKGFDESTWTFKEICGSKCLPKLLSEKYESLSENDKMKWKTRSSDSVKEFFSTEDGKTALSKAAESNKAVSKQARTKRIATLKKLYGKEWYNSDKATVTKKNFSEEKKTDIDKRRDTTNYIKYGKSKCSDPAREKRSQWAKDYLIPASKKYCLENYGVDNPSILLKASISKISIEFFKELSINLDNVYYGTNEWYISEKSIGFFKYDFKYNNKIIEFNGDYWHANPNRYSPEDIVYFPRGKKFLAMDIWEKDYKKVLLAEAKGFEVKVIWESDVRTRKHEIMEELRAWLKS